MLGVPHEYRLQILEGRLDSFGHVNNAAYLEILEEARWDLITRNGYGLAEMQQRQLGPVVLELQMRFVRELRNRQWVLVRSWVESYPGKVGHLVQQIVDEQGELCCDALFTVGLFDLRSRRLVRPTAEWVAALGLSEDDLGRQP